jgi:putative membrane protein
MNADNLQQSRTAKDYVALVAKGFAMGASDVVPGVSGGTMAFILGIYEELLNSIKDMVSRKAFKIYFGFRIKEALAVLPWRFLLALAIGVLTAIFALAPYLEWLLLHHPVYLWSFFFGLVLASIITVSRRISHWSALIIGAVIAGTVVAYLIVGLVPAQTPDTYWFLFFSGFIASCAMILPGISGSFILLILGKYQTILAAVVQRDFVTLFIVAAGVGVGLVTIAQVLSWLFKHYRDVTVAVLIGLMAGSLRKIWPWKETTEFILDRHGEQVPIEQLNVMPAAWSSEVAIALLLAIVGFSLVFSLEYWAMREEPTPIVQQA